MKQHSFIFGLGNWAGEGKIKVNVIQDELAFKTVWGVASKDMTGKVCCTQDIQISGIPEALSNELSFYDFGDKQFSVEMKNENVGRIIGVGYFDEKRISWEFRNKDQDFEGFETYALQTDGSYQMHAEYVTSDQIRTKIESKIWPNGNPSNIKDETQEGPLNS